MIEEFIEKDVIRRVKLVEYIFELKTISLRELSERLDVTVNTIKTDIHKLMLELAPFITYNMLTTTHITMLFSKEATDYDLVKEVYKESHFLKVVARYLLGETNYLTIVEEDFVSTTKAFRTKKNVENFLIAQNFQKIGEQFKADELTYRMLFVTIWMRTDLLNKIIDQRLLVLASSFVKQIFETFSSNYNLNNRQYKFLLYHTYLCLSRSEKQMFFANETTTQTRIEYQQLSVIAKKIFKKNELSSKNLTFLTAICSILPIRAKNYSIIELNYQNERIRIIENQQQIKYLINLFEEEFETVLFHNESFEIPFIYFVYSLWENIQNYYLERNYYLSTTQLHYVSRVENVLNRWKETTNDNTLHFNPLSIVKFTSEILPSLTIKRAKKYVCMIIAETELSHIIYRHTLKKWLNPEFIFIDENLYYSIDDIPVYREQWPYIIVCERTLQTRYTQLEPNFFYISRNTLLKDTKYIVDSFYELNLMNPNILFKQKNE